MTDLDTTTLDTLVERLERAAEQLRTGDLSAELERMARAAQQEPIPGQDSLL